MFSADGKTSLIIDTDRAYCPNTKILQEEFKCN